VRDAGRHQRAEVVQLRRCRALRALAQRLFEVVGAGVAHEDPGPGARQQVRALPGVLQGLVGGHQQQPLLRVEFDRLGGGHPEELGVEVGDVVEVAGAATGDPPRPGCR